MLQSLRREPGFYRHLWALALPLVLQNLITTSLGFADTFMVGLLGNEQLSAVTAANTPIFLVEVMVFGLMSGLTVLASQYWGKGDIAAINRAMGVAMYLAAAISALMTALLCLAPGLVMGLVTDNETLIALGIPYLQIVGGSYLFNSLTSVYVGMQRSTENPAFGTAVFSASMVLNVILNYIFIFGHFGAPAMGITGAALATLLSRISELVITVVYALTTRRVPLMPRQLFSPGTAIVKSFLRYSAPVIFNETLWGLGTSVLVAVMGHMAISTQMLSAYSIMGSIDKFSTVICFGLAGASAVIVGKRIGEGQRREEVYSLALCLLTVCTLAGLAVAVCLGVLLPTVFIPVLYPLFKLSAQATEIATVMCVIYLFVMPMRAYDITNITGILRAGGDSRFAAVLDLCPLWFAAIPLTALSALVLDAPVWLVCLCSQCESFFKMPVGVLRLRSRKWINNVTVRGEDV